MSTSKRTEQALLIVFADLTHYRLNASRMSDVELAELLHGYYVLAEQLVTGAGGRLVKFMGDAFLAVWPEALASRGAASLVELKERIDAWWAAQRWDSTLVVKAHFGRAVAGPFGTEGRFDVLGNEVNIAATLPARTLSLSAEAFRQLDAEARKVFKKHTAAVVYIPAVDQRPH